jgi:hypothetical protein
MEEKDKLLEIAKQKLKKYQKKKSKLKSDEPIENEEVQVAAVEEQVIKEAVSSEPESNYKFEEIEALRVELASVRNLVDSQTTKIANQKKELLLKLKEKNELELYKLKEVNLLLEKNEFLTQENVNYSKRIDELVKQTVVLTRTISSKDLAQEIQLAHTTTQTLEKISLDMNTQTVLKRAETNTQTSPSTVISETLIPKETSTESSPNIQIEPELVSPSSQGSGPQIHHNKKLKKKSIDPTSPQIDISTLTTKLLSLEQQNLLQQQKITQNEHLISKIHELESINQGLKSRVKEDERVIILLEAQVDEIPDMIFHYHQERKELLKRINVGNWASGSGGFPVSTTKGQGISTSSGVLMNTNGIMGKGIGTSPGVLMNTNGIMGKGIGTSSGVLKNAINGKAGVSIITSNDTNSSMNTSNGATAPALPSITAPTIGSVTLEDQMDEEVYETEPLLANESFEILQYRSHSELVCCDCVNNQMISI